MFIIYRCDRQKQKLSRIPNYQDVPPVIDRKRIERFQQTVVNLIEALETFLGWNYERTSLLRATRCLLKEIVISHLEWEPTSTWKNWRCKMVEREKIPIKVSAFFEQIIYDGSFRSLIMLHYEIFISFCWWFFASYAIHFYSEDAYREWKKRREISKIK